jgi:hypothetical protein
MNPDQPTMGLVCELLDHWGAERVLRFLGLSVEQLLTLARELEGARDRGRSPPICWPLPMSWTR